MIAGAVPNSFFIHRDRCLEQRGGDVGRPAGIFAFHVDCRIASTGEICDHLCCFALFGFDHTSLEVGDDQGVSLYFEGGEVCGGLHETGDGGAHGKDTTRTFGKGLDEVCGMPVGNFLFPLEFRQEGERNGWIGTVPSGGCFVFPLENHRFNGGSLF